MRYTLACITLAVAASVNTSNAYAADAVEASAAPTCTTYIDTLPYAINAPGYYCLRKDLATDYYLGAIVVYASDVTVDCRNRKLSVAPGASRAGTNGVHLDMGVSRTTVQNCLFQGFDIGIWTPFDGSGNSARNNRVDQFISAGIQGGGEGFEAINNRITNGVSLYGGSTGISLIGDFTQGGSNGQVVMNNLVAGLNGMIATGISVTDSKSLRIINNHVATLKGIEPNGAANGMTFGNTPDLQLINNAISAMSTEQVFRPMQSNVTPSLCRGNTISNSYQASFYGCTRSLDNINVFPPAY